MNLLRRIYLVSLMFLCSKIVSRPLMRLAQWSTRLLIYKAHLDKRMLELNLSTGKVSLGQLACEKEKFEHPGRKR